MDETGVIVGFCKPRIEPQSIAEFVDGAEIIFLLRVGLPQQNVDRCVAGILLKQPAENTGSSAGLMRAYQGRSPCEEQARIVGRMFSQRLQYVNNLGIVL